ncbi:hypothetical protein GCM10010517_13340 [Streptosporangium fragile]|uniref:Alcohol dehydrogenase-like N-terminal domain-containing protein n=1 Tax=Streptosporangium fragile TaxID=46186 RepID=A0ABP6IAW0_9ACTN
MRAAVWYGAKDIRVEDVPVTPPGPGEVTIQVAYCGICGSDLHEYADGPHAIPVGDPHPESGVAAPLVLGHEFCGTLCEVGGGVRAGRRRPARGAPGRDPPRRNRRRPRSDGARRERARSSPR